MDLGDPFKQPLTIQPAGDGTFIVTARTISDKLSVNVQSGFPTIDDLLIWMAKHGAKTRVTELSEGDVVAARYEAIRSGAALAPDKVYIGDPIDRHKPLDPFNGLRRTTAAETLAQRAATACNRAAGDTGPQPAA